MYPLQLLSLLAISTLTAAQGLNCPNTLSCHVPTNVDTCCTEHPGGLVVLTQFWDYSPARGPADSWTIHGLWPDNCDGSFSSACDPARAYPDPAQILEDFKQQDLLTYMRTYWKGQRGDENLWQHEFANHGTCLSTLEPSCYGEEYVHGKELVDYMQQAVNLHKERDSYSWLNACGITPSLTKTYGLDDIKSCLQSAFGAVPYVGCTGKNLSEIWYYHWVRGRAFGGKYEATDSTANSKCPQSGIKYVPK
ncbi:ribonuclease T2 [Wilcoxina mikolae CBS 423.85]|nr:ribonuclease T2 [Wilcoxina mikolae CBS 423.85]